MFRTPANVVVLIFCLIVPNLIFFLLSKIGDTKRKAKMAVVISASILLTGAALWQILNSNKEGNKLVAEINSAKANIEVLKAKIDGLSIENATLNINVEKLISVTKAGYVESPFVFETFIKYYLDNPNRDYEITNYSEDNIPSGAVLKKLEGFLLLAKNKNYDAVKEFEDALRICPSFYTAKLGPALAYRKIAMENRDSNNLEELNIYFSKAKKQYIELQALQRKININDSRPYHHLAFCYIFIKPDFVEAESILIKALRFDKTSGEIFNC